MSKEIIIMDNFILVTAVFALLTIVVFTINSIIKTKREK